jgi:uncharacterized membrane protein
MQAVNVLILKAWFLSAFVGTTVLCGVALAWSLTRGPLSAALLPVAGSAGHGDVVAHRLVARRRLLYLVGVVGITRVFNTSRATTLSPPSLRIPLPPRHFGPII